MFEMTLDESTNVFVGTALPSTLLRTVSLSNRVAVRLEIRTGIHPEGQALSLHRTL